MGQIIAMIPARMGSQRLPKKNLRTLRGVPLIVRAIRKCQEADCFDEIWVNSEHEAFGPIAETEGVHFHQRPEELGNNQANSEEYITEFFQAHECERLAQVHSIAPLLTAAEVRAFMGAWTNSDHDVMLSCIHDQIEVAYQNQPVNFTFAEKTNSQDLQPTQRITWSITGFSRAAWLEAVEAGKNASYHGSIGFFPVSPIAGHVIKTQRDLDVADALFDLVEAPATTAS